VYSKSISQAMEAALRSTLESSPHRLWCWRCNRSRGASMTPRRGITRRHRGVRSCCHLRNGGRRGAVAGRFAGPSAGAGAGSGAGGSAAAGATTSASNPNASVPYQQGGPNVTVNVMGHIYGSGGIEELASAINDAVLNRTSSYTQPPPQQAAVGEG